MVLQARLSSLLDIFNLLGLNSLLNLNFFALFLCLALMFLVVRLFIARPSRRVFLIDFSCYKPPVAQAATKDATVNLFQRDSNMSKETIEFMRWAIHRSGLGESTHVPEALLKDPPNLTMEEGRRESEMVLFGAVDELLVKTKVKCDDIGILVVNCSLFHVTSSLSSVIINKYKFRNNIVNYNLSGMGCSAGLLAIGLAKQLFQVHHNSYALVVSTETLAPYIYMGNDGSKSLANCIFRVGGAAILLSNQPSDSRSSKYELIHAVHSYTASSDSSYNCITQEEDEEGREGITITKDLSIAAVDAIKSNLISLGPLVLPFSERARYLLNYIMRRLHVANIKPYVPNFKRTFDHFLPHVGTKPLLDGLQKNLGLSEDDMEASRMTLYRFGNTSSSSVWYELAYAEAKRKIKKGDRVWQIAFGSGFKCTSLIWHAMRAVDREEMNPWSDEIDGFPVDLTNIPSAAYFKSSI